MIRALITALHRNRRHGPRVRVYLGDRFHAWFGPQEPANDN